MTPEEKFVAFVDMLGFSILTETYELDRYVFDELQRPGAIEFLRASLEGMDANPLAERFIRFHLLLDGVARNSRLGHDCSMITFSDCAFFASDYSDPVVSFAVGVMHRALEERIPVRIGIGHGDFFVVRMKADFQLSSQDHVVQFLGSGVTRAHAAEHCGVRGMRILLHPTTVELVTTSELVNQFKLPTRGDFIQPLPLPASERANKCGVAHELNYLGHARHHDTCWKAVHELRSVAPEKELHHYEATLSALNRMKEAMGEPPFST